MKKFIAYFDFLGFKDFIMNNPLDDQKQGMKHLYRDIELALSKRKTIPKPHGNVADLAEIRINCVNFSDTVVFWSNDDSVESFREILETSYNFNWHQNRYTFPVRGAIVYDEIIHVDFRITNVHSSKYNVNSLYGKGLVRAHLKAESQEWAGTVIDSTVIEYLKVKYPRYAAYLEEFAMEYEVPYKESYSLPGSEYALRLVAGNLNDETFKNVADGIVRNFGELRKDSQHPSAQKKLANTLEFLKKFKG